MKRQICLLTGLAGLAILATTLAQQPAPNQGAGKSPEPAATPAKATIPADARDEEIEIMRRLLQGALERQRQDGTVFLPTRVKAAAFSPDGNTLGVEVVPGTAVERRAIFIDPLSNLPYPLQDVQGNVVERGAIRDADFPVEASYWIDMSTAGRLSWNTLIPGHAHLRDVHVPEAVYLKGHGVVYTATVDLPPTAPIVSEASQPAPPPASDWERTRRELRGEKAEPAKAPPREALADAVLKVLAKNGSHFTKLDDNEQITVAITLPRVAECTQCHAVPATLYRRATLSGLPTRYYSVRTVLNLKDDKVDTDGKSQAPGIRGTDNTIDRAVAAGAYELKVTAEADKLNAVKDEFQKQVLLGDLHMKQGKNEQAAAAFEAALKVYADNLELQRRQSLDAKGTADTDAQMEKDYRLTAAKLLQVYAALGKKQEMQQTLKRLDAHVEKAWNASGATKPPPPTPEKEELPAKLVISVPKKLLELAGKMTFDEFRKNATIDYQPAKTIAK